MTWPIHWPVFGICGYSGSGKTTLAEGLIPRLRERGLTVAVIKHDAHGMILDKPGKDTDRFFQAGATVFGHDPGQAFLRLRSSGEDRLHRAVELLLPTHDIILVEGHKQTPLPAKIWLEADGGDEPPTDCGPWLARLDRGADRVVEVSEMLDGWLANQIGKQPLRGGLLLGGTSRRMGTPKQMLMHQGRAWAEWVAEAMLAHVDEICLLGRGPVPESLRQWPQLPDAPGLGGPLAGMTAALRWDPAASWLFLPCDVPLMNAEALAWLLDQRVPGRWAVMPRMEGSEHVEPLGAWYDPRLGPTLAACRGPREAAKHEKVGRPTIPAAHSQCWRGFNTAKEAADLS